MYQIHFASAAEDDLDESYHYILFSLKNPIAAENLLSTVEEKLKPLQEMPHSGSLIKDSYLSNLGIRFVPVNNYLAFYQVDEREKVVNIVRFLYARRSWENIVKESES